MEKLTIKELAPYLPYKLKYLYGSLDEGDIIEPEGMYEFGDIYDSEIGDIPLDHLRPILRPLSDLTKDENFELYLELCEELGVVRCEHLLLALRDNLKYAFNIKYLNVLEEFMYKNHFDWKFGLIEKGLAIDINTI